MKKILAILIAIVLIQSCKEDEYNLTNDYNFEEEVINLAEDPFQNTVCGSSVTLDAGVENASYLWSTGDTTQIIKLYHSLDNSFGGLYKVYITTNGSTWTDSVFIIASSSSFYIPNAFSPNGDGVNDIFNIFASCIVKSHLKILNNFNRKVLFESNDINRGWDGSYKGNLMPAGEYPYEVEITFFDGQLYKRHGTIELVR